VAKREVGKDIAAVCRLSKLRSGTVRKTRGVFSIVNITRRYFGGVQLGGLYEGQDTVEAVMEKGGLSWKY